jgi:hypothetical protein
MNRSRKPTVGRAAPLSAIRGCGWWLKRLYLTRPRLISNLLALVALFSIGFV